MVGPTAQTSGNLAVMDPFSILHSCDALQPPVILELPLVPTMDRPVFSTPFAPLVGSVPTLASSHTINSGSLFLGLFTIFAILGWKARGVRKTIKELKGSMTSTSVQNTAHYLTINATESKSSQSISSDLDNTLDEPSLVSPTGSGYFTTPSSPKMLTTNDTPSPMSFSIDSPAFQHIWKSSAQATAEIAHKKRRTAIVSKLQRWAAKRHEQAAQEARSLKPSTSGSRELAFNGSGDGLSSLLVSADDMPSGSFGSDRSVSPRAAQKLRFRREGLKARAREVEAIRAALYDGDEL